MLQKKSLISYSISDVTPYINWIYFFHAWGFQPKYAAIANVQGCDVCRASWITQFTEEERPKAAEAMQLFKEANRMLIQLSQDYHVMGLFRLCEAYSQGDDLWLDGTCFPLLRQQSHVQEKGSPFLCLSDFVHPFSTETTDHVGVFATTVSSEIELLYENDAYKRMLVQTLADRLAEACAEKMHEEVRKKIWGYVPDEDLTMPDLWCERFQGIRPAVGYPSLPDQSVNFIIDDLLNLSDIGIDLTENAAMRPHASVTGLMFAHPDSVYFSVGLIDDDQFKDYASRRKLDLVTMRKFLAANL